ncbi:histidine kinase [uncultured Proteiniphilum sp.]|uniref:sensor histidine kinase n=1 Tax=uncultured Proteiniphilum sp. TaxID=497637 RepID=UPI0026163F83|nr:histidine kinase [uncultured Proteiniphilum sp.]
MKRSTIIVINLLIACIIGLIIIFPDFTRHMNRYGEDFQPTREQSSLERERIGGQPERMVPDPARRMPPFDNHQLPVPPSLRNAHSRLVFDFVSFFFLALFLLYFNTRNLLLNTGHQLDGWKNTVVSIGGSLVICTLFLVFRTLITDFPRQAFHLNGMDMFKTLSAGIITVLYGSIIILIYRQQQMKLENQSLKTENLQATYNVLTAQINPHFFFNSLNTLSALVREQQKEASLKYINELSHIFRYVLNSNKKELVALQEELYFLNAYRYMLEIRYEDKLFFDIHIDGKYLRYLLPVLSFQPVIENIIKHNVISEKKPLTICIYITEEEQLAISNPIRPKLGYEENTGIGLKNLTDRYRLLLSENILIENDGRNFTVKLPIVEKTRFE